MLETQFNSHEEASYSALNTSGYQPAGLIGFLIKIFRGHIKAETATNILIVITVVSFTLSAIIFSSIFFSQKNTGKLIPKPISKEVILPAIKQEFPEITDSMLKQLPETFYREDIPPDMANKLSQEIINSIPPRP